MIDPAAIAQLRVLTAQDIQGLGYSRHKAYELLRQLGHQVGDRRYISAAALAEAQKGKAA